MGITFENNDSDYIYYDQFIKCKTPTSVKYPSIDNVNLNSTRSWKGDGDGGE